MKKLRILFVCAFFSTVMNAQQSSVLDGRTPKGIEPGSPAGTYALSGLDTINLYNGNANISIPLYQIGGRGEAGYTIQGNVTKKPWYIYTYTYDANTGAIPCPPNSSSCYTYYSYSAGGGPDAELDVRYKPAVIFARSGTDFSQVDCGQPSGVIGITAATLTRLTVVMGDGSEIELSDQQDLSRVWPWGITQGGRCDSPQPPQHDRGAIFVSTDASNTVFVSDTHICDDLTQAGYVGTNYSGTSCTTGGANAPTGTLYFRDGRQIRFQRGYPLWIRDRDGNQTTFDYSPTCTAHAVQPPCNVVDQPVFASPYYPVLQFDVTDSAGRVTHVRIGDDDSVNGAGATKDTITPPFGPAIVVRSRPYWNSTDCPSCGGAAPYLNTLFPQHGPLTPIAYSGVYQIQLPSGNNTYSFLYNQYAEIIRLTLPTGGAIEYDWQSGTPGHPGADGAEIIGPSPQQGFFLISISRQVMARREYANAPPTAFGSSNYTRLTTYNINPLTGATDTTDPFSNSSDPGAFAYRCVATTIANGTGQPYNNRCTRTSATETDGSGAVLAYQDHYFYGSAVNPDTLFPNNLASKYAPWMEGREFRTVTAANPALENSPLRDEIHTFAQRAYPYWWSSDGLYQPPAGDPRLAQTDQVNDTGQLSRRVMGYSADTFNNVTDVYEYDLGSGGPGPLIRHTVTTYQTSAAYTSAPPNLIALPLTQTVLDGPSGAIKSQTQYCYDEGGAAGGTSANPSCAVANASQGNASHVWRWRDADGLWLGTGVQFDSNGSLIQVQNPKGSQTTLTYTCSNSFVHTVTNALNQTTTYDYGPGFNNSDCSLDKPTRITDPNAMQITGVYSADALGRLTQVTRDYQDSLQNGTAYVYSSDLTTVTSSADLNSSGDGALITDVITDKLGGKFQTKVHAPEGTITSQTDLDALGRVECAHNPTLGTPASTCSDGTAYTYDALGRVLTATYADGSVEHRNYSGATSQEIDAAGKTRWQQIDALGRLKRVVEAPTASFPTVPTCNPSSYTQDLCTDYTYDALDDLLSVVQGSQTRTFTYDSLKLLHTALNPESGTVATYSYDYDGNLSQKVDSGVTITYGYDGLDRIASKTYTDGTPNVTYCYDGLTWSSSSGLCSGTASAPSIGRLTGTASSVSSETFGYDRLGRIIASTQTTPAVSGTPYPFQYAYNLAGSLTAETYPSGRVMTTGYDSAGRASGLSGNLSGFATSYASGITYTPHGAISSLMLGNGLTEAWSYSTTRLQPTSIQIGSLLTLAYSYGTTNNNGNVQSQTITRSGPSWQQSYSYDTLNRLTGSQETSTGGNLTYAWSYDQYGNRWETSPNPPTLETPQTSNWYVATCPGGGSTCNHIGGWTYDGRGNIQSVANMQRAFSYDGENRQTSASINSFVTTYAYDGDGKRITRTSSGAMTTYVYDAFNNLAAEYGGQNPSVGTNFLSVDHLGSTRLVTNGAGAVVQCHDYMPFGDEAVSGVDGRGSCFPSALSAGIEFTSKERDSETGLDFFDARYMSSAQGRFTSPDPFGLLSARPQDPQSWNLYAYVRNNPLVLIDPNGLDCVNATDSQGGFTVNHDTNSGACGKGGGTWVPGYVDESWVSWNKKTHHYQVTSIDAAGSYDPNSGFNSTVDYATFKPGAETDANGKCLSGCKGYGFSSASTDWLESQFVGKSGLNGYMGFLAGRDQELSLFSKIAFGGLAFWKNNWAGPGGMGAPGGRGDWAASVHDFNFDQNGPIKIPMYFNPTISPATAKALIQSNNMLIRNAGGGPQAAKFGIFFGAVNAFQFLQSWK